MFSLKFFIYFAVLFISFGVITARSTSKSTPKCDYTCEGTYAPVCVTLRDGTQKEFHSMCVYLYGSCMGLVDAKVVDGGPCKSISKPTPPKCDDVCERIYAPVCVTLQDGTQKEFANMCYYEYDSCMGLVDGKVVKSGPCKSISKPTPPKCDDVCERIYAPVCVTLQDGTQKEFANMCYYEYDSCMGLVDGKVVKSGPCKSISKPTPPKCVYICYRMYDPVCVTLQDGTQREFPNICYYQYETCMGLIAYGKFVKSGPCK